MLSNVELREGLERIDDMAFSYCTSLQGIVIPSTVKMIGECAFSSCTQMRHVELREGLKAIHEWAFRECNSLQQISIPSTIDFIHRDAFYNSRGLVVIKFSSDIEMFLSEVSLREWLVADDICNLPAKYTELVQRNIPMRFEKMTLTSGKLNIRDILSRIPSRSSRDWSFYFDPIESKLVHYLELQECVMELLDNTVVSCITPHVLPYL